MGVTPRRKKKSGDDIVRELEALAGPPYDQWSEVRVHFCTPDGSVGHTGISTYAYAQTQVLIIRALTPQIVCWIEMEADVC